MEVSFFDCIISVIPAILIWIVIKRNMAVSPGENGGTGGEGSGDVTDEGNTSDNSHTNDHDKLLFHKSCGKNVLVVNGQRTLRKKKQSVYEYTTAFTNRPLKDNEIFNVRIDNAVGKGSIAIGVTIDTPENAARQPNNSTSKNTWVIYSDKIYVKGNLLPRGDGIPLEELMIGETVGVMKTKLGDLHLFIDGTDIGVVAGNIPSTVYGFFELFMDGKRGTIEYS